MSLEISSSDAGRKQLRMAGSLGGEDCEVEDGAAEERDACSLVIFFREVGCKRLSKF